MTFLAIDTSESACSIALLDGSTVVDSKSEMIGRGHAERLLPLIEERLAAAGLSYADLTRIAVTTGPGTFTGLRIGLAVARGLALQGNLPCVGLTGLQVLAASANSLACASPVYAVIAGRAGQAFVQKFASDRFLDSVDAVANLDMDAIGQMVEGDPGTVVSTSREITELFAGRGFEVIFLEAIDVVTLGRLALDLDPLAHPPEPTYFRAADAKKATPILTVAPT
jgi:tRNA threonylcarbamoyladenosine biosynthesis protein TsaB